MNKTRDGLNALGRLLLAAAVLGMLTASIAAAQESSHEAPGGTVQASVDLNYDRSVQLNAGGRHGRDVKRREGTSAQHYIVDMVAQAERVRNFDYFFQTERRLRFAVHAGGGVFLQRGNGQAGSVEAGCGEERNALDGQDRHEQLWGDDRSVGARVRGLWICNDQQLGKRKIGGSGTVVFAVQRRPCRGRRRRRRRAAPWGEGRRAQVGHSHDNG